MGERGLVKVAVLGLLAVLLLPGAVIGAKSSPGKVKSTGALETRALKRFPDSFGGLYLEKGKVVIAFTSRGKQRVAALGRSFAKPKRLRAVKVDDSLASLQALQAKMIADRQTNPVMGTDAAGRPVALAYDLDIDVRGNIVVAIVEQAVTPALSSAFMARYGPDVIFKQAPIAEPHVCNAREDCPPFLRSGLRTDSSTGCSTAFGVLYQVPGERVDGLLSAAHCGNPDANVGETTKHNGVAYGKVVSEQQSGKVDAELHSVDNGFFSFFPLIYRSNADQAASVGKVGTYNALTIGQNVCKAGITTGETCGPVESKNYSPSYVSNGSNFIKADICSDKGDSGAGVYIPFERTKKGSSKKLKRYEAVGVHSGGAKDTPCSSSAHYGLFGHIEFVKSALGVTVLANPN